MFIEREGPGYMEGTSLAAWCGWLICAAPGVWLFYLTSWWGGLCRQVDTLSLAIMLNSAAIVLLGIWISRLRAIRGRSQRLEGGQETGARHS
jgi:hypothetical protein